MKRVLIGDHRESLLSTVEVVLRHLGYRVLVSSSPSRLEDFLQETSPDLMLLGADLLEKNPGLRCSVEAKASGRSIPLAVLECETKKAVAEPGREVLPMPLDLFDLFALVQRHLENIPRRHLRLAVRLPGMLCLGEDCNLVQLLSLSSRGMFVKTSSRMNDEQPLKVIIPLMGMKRELEVTGRILYRVHPTPENNYLEGVGVGFTDLDRAAAEALDAFIAGRFLGDLDDVLQPAVRSLSDSQSSTVTLRLTGRG